MSSHSLSMTRFPDLGRVWPSFVSCLLLAVGLVACGGGGGSSNQPPTITSIADQSTISGTSVGPLAFTVGDVETAAAALTLSTASSNTTLVSVSDIVLGGSDASRTVTVTPASGETGSTTITVTVSDGSLTAQAAFVLTVTPGAFTSTYAIIDISAGPTATSYPTTALDAVPAGGWTDEHKASKIVLRRIPAGIYTMGSPSGELGRSSNENQHLVTLSDDFYIGVFEITQAQWQNVMGSNPSGYAGDTRPVDCVSWDGARGGTWAGVSGGDPVATSFTGLLRARTANIAFDLPTEAQWEYAARAGTTTALNSGEDLTGSTTCTNLDLLGLYKGNRGSPQHTDVGSYAPNAWGLYDMHGNVWEWCLDWYETNLGTASVSDPGGPPSGTSRVWRGGSWYEDAHYCRSAVRLSNTPSTEYGNLGFRLAAPGQPGGDG